MGAPRRALLLVSLLLCMFCVRGSVLRAATVTTDCAGLQDALANASDGDTVILTEMCTVSNSGASAGQFYLDNGPSDSRSYTLEGLAGSGAGFDGTGGALGDMVLAQGAAFSPASLTLRNLIFMNGSDPFSGGALAILGGYSVTLDHDTFTNNQTVGAHPGPGGAVDIETDAPSATITISNSTFTNNQATGGGIAVGGAVDLFIFSDSSIVTLDNDTFTGNQANLAGGAVEIQTGASSGSLTFSNSVFVNNAVLGGSSGGALDMCVCGAPLPVTLVGNFFSVNHVAGDSFGATTAGGAVAVQNTAGGNAALTQIGNVFSGNSLNGGTGDAYGGAEATGGMTLSSTGDIFTGNSIQAPGIGQLSQGAALSLSNDCSDIVPPHTGTNLAIAGNSIVDGGEAANAQGALAVSCEFGPGNPIGLLLNDATIAGNTGGGGTAGVWGDPSDELTLQNSILTGNTDGVDFSGFTGPTATFSDICDGGNPFVGTGNICTDPLLANAAAGDVHETSASPTIDLGSSALVPAGLTTDVYGVQRIQRRALGGTALVDMGAAEFPALNASPAISTAASPGVMFGGQVSDAAILSGGYSPTGTITFRLYGPSDSTCGGSPAFTNAINVTGNGVYLSPSVTPAQIGTYRWIASYSGDSNNNAVAGACNDANESVTIAIANQTITFIAPGDKTFGDAPFDVSASASSGLTVTFSSTTTSVCTVSNTTVTPVAHGACTIAADQGGNVNYRPAPQVTQTFGVNVASDVRMSVDLPGMGMVIAASYPFQIGGWALDLGAGSGAGVDAVDVWAYPLNGLANTPSFLGAVTPALARADIGSQFGNQFANAGWLLSAAGLPAGHYRLFAFAHSSVTGVFTAPQTVDVTSQTVVAAPDMALDAPRSNMTFGSSLLATGWAVDTGAPYGTGVDAVHVWAYPIVGQTLGTPVFLGAATLGLSRPDVGTVLGAQFAPSGFALQASGLQAGLYRVMAFARSTFSGTFNQSALADITIAAGLVPNPLMAIDGPPALSTQTQPFLTAGWALDFGAGVGPGVDAVHVWAVRVSDGAQTFLGAASYGSPRSDVGTMFGSTFTNSGYALSISGLAAGTYDLFVYAHSTVTGTFNQVQAVRVTVN